MKRNDLCGETEFEKQLRDRMNRLSGSVDCFDKIAERAFPERSEDFSDSGSTVTDLENISGKRRAAPVLRWTAIAAAAVLIVGVLPKTALMNSIMSNLSGSKRRKFNELLTHITEQTSAGEYKVYDLSLGEYAGNDVLVTPMYSCPFADTGKAGMSVKIFVRMCGTVPTNEMYAVEYSGEYKEENIVAAAATGIEFTGEEIEELKTRADAWESYSDKALVSAVEYNFTEGETYPAGEYSILHNGKKTSAASFSYQCWFKSENETEPLNADVLWYTAETENRYNYDISVTCADGGSSGETFIPAAVWGTSLSFEGSNALPDVSQSSFTKEELFGKTPGRYRKCIYAFCCPHSSKDGIEEMTARSGTSSETVYSGYTPYDAYSKRTMRVYISPAAAEGMPDGLQFYSTGSASAFSVESFIMWEGTDRVFFGSDGNGWSGLNT